MFKGENHPKKRVFLNPFIKEAKGGPCVEITTKFHMSKMRINPHSSKAH